MMNAVTAVGLGSESMRLVDRSSGGGAKGWNLTVRRPHSCSNLFNSRLWCPQPSVSAHGAAVDGWCDWAVGQRSVSWTS